MGIHSRQDGDIVGQIKNGNLLYLRDEESLSVFGGLTNPSLGTYKTKQALSDIQLENSSESQVKK